MMYFATPTLVFLAFWGGIHILRSGTKQTRAFLLALLVSGIGYILVFRNASFIHSYYKIYLFPALALAAGAALIPSAQPRTRRSDRRIHAVKVAFIVLTFVTSGYIVWALHRILDQNNLMPLVTGIVENTSQDDHILSNLPDTGFGLEYYAMRPIEYEIDPQTALKLAESLPQNQAYLFCGQGNPAIELDAYTYVVLGNCRLYRLSTSSG